MPSKHGLLALIFLVTGYAPVTVSDNEAAGSSEESECNESEDVEKGILLERPYSTVIAYTSTVAASNQGQK